MRSKNTLNTFPMCVVAMVLWALIGYSLAFDGGGAILGGLGHVGPSGVGFAPATVRRAARGARRA